MVDAKVVHNHHYRMSCGGMPDLTPCTDFYGGGFLRNSYYDDHNDALLLRIGDESKRPNFVVMGDSHANALFPALDTLGREQGLSGIFLRSYLVPFKGIRFSFLGKDAFMNSDDTLRGRQLAWLQRHPELRTVIIAQFWRARAENVSYNRNLVHTADGTELTGKPIPMTILEPALRAYCQRVRDIGKELIIVAPDQSWMRLETYCSGTSTTTSCCTEASRRKQSR